MVPLLCQLIWVCSMEFEPFVVYFKDDFEVKPLEWLRLGGYFR